ncbi:MAG: DUF4157 domain-containing protein [Acidobacteria bacterium]|nr:DUF4157 domain-containing protein [Acidobacteriota bacterium]
MRTFAPKQDQAQPEASSRARSNMVAPGRHPRAELILHLQRTIGNQAVQRLLRAKSDDLEAYSSTDDVARFAHDFSPIPVQAKSPASVQAELTVNQPGDIYEQEADRVSEQVMRMPEPQLRRACPCGGGCPECQTEQPGQEHERLQTKRVQASDPGQTAAPPIVHEVLSSPGRPLEPTARAFMEPRFGHDFSRIRIHNDLRATESAQAIDALAYTLGEHIVFGAGQYAPNTSDGKQLLSHELTHSMQQHQGQIHRRPRSVKIGKPTISTDSEQARLKARELAELINTGKWKQENNEQLARWLEFFEDIALASFIDELQDAIGRKITEFEGEEKEHTDIFATSTEANLIIPTSEAKVARGGFKVAYFAQIFEETSESTSVEVYNDVSASAGFSVEVPIGKVAKFKFGVEAKRGRKTAEREEEKTASRSGRTISRSFTIQKLEREVMNYQYIKTYIAPAPIAKEVTRTKTGHGAEIQHGFQIVPDEGGKPWGPFWNVYSGHVQVEGSALPHVWEVLTAEQKKIAEDLVFGRR